MDETNEVLRRALAFARTEPLRALEILESGLKKARSVSGGRGVAILAKHAGALSTRMGDLHLAARYYDEAISHDPQDAYLRIALGDILRSLGKRDEARAAIIRGMELASDGGDADKIEVATRALARLNDDAD